MRINSMRKRLQFNTFLTIYIGIFVFCGTASADMVYLKNGGELEGVVKKEDNEEITLEVRGGEIVINKNEIRSIERSDTDANKVMKAKFEENKTGTEDLERQSNAERDRRFDEYDRWQNAERKKKEEEAVESKEVQAIPGKIFEGERVSDSILVEAVINDKVKVMLVVDTGATSVTLQRRIGEQLGFDMSDTKKDIFEVELADGRRVKEKRVVLKKISIQGMEESGVPAAIALEDIESPALRDGLLGMSFLNRFNFKIDRKTMKITLERLKK